MVATVPKWPLRSRSALAGPGPAGGSLLLLVAACLCGRRPVALAAAGRRAQSNSGQNRGPGTGLASDRDLLASESGAPPRQPAAVLLS
jgi:hypothetical protein